MPKEMKTGNTKHITFAPTLIPSELSKLFMFTLAFPVYSLTKHALFDKFDSFKIISSNFCLLIRVCSIIVRTS